MKHNVSNKKRKSNSVELFALALLIHFFGDLLYGVFNALFYRSIMASTNHPWLLSVWHLNLLVGCLSIPSIIVTMILEWLYVKPMSMVVAKYLFQVWIFGVCLLILWAVVSSM